MSAHQFRNLERGDIVRNYGSLESFVVMANYGNRVTAVRTADITNPAEWLIEEKQNQRR